MRWAVLGRRLVLVTHANREKVDCCGKPEDGGPFERNQLRLAVEQYSRPRIYSFCQRSFSRESNH